MDQDSPKEVFCEGRNVEEALQAACDKMNTTPNQVEYEVVRSGGGGGMLGFLKGRATRIRVWKKSEAQRKLTGLLRGFFEQLDLDTEFEVTRADDAYEVNVESEASDGLLIGRGGETLAALQHIVSRMASNLDEDLRVRVDVAGYRRRRHEQLRRKAKELADRAHSSGRETITEALPADERRIIHLALADDPRVDTRAIGEGLTKRVRVIASGKEAPGAETRSGAGRPGSSRRRGRGGRGEPSESREGGGERSGRSRGDQTRRRRTRRPREEQPVAARGDGLLSEEERAGRGGGRGARRGGRRSSTGPSRGNGGSGAEVARRERRPEAADRERRPEAADRERRSEAADRERRPERARRERRPEAPRREEAPEGQPAVERHEEEQSYFQIPKDIGLVKPAERPTRSQKREEGADEAGERPVSFGRRPRPGKRRR